MGRKPGATIEKMSTTKKKLLAIIGTRPQYIKHAAFEKATREDKDVELVTVDTGQHYDFNMSQSFVDDLSITNIKYNLDIKSGPHGRQTASMMLGLEPILERESPNFVIVYGDTNSTLAGALVASKMNVPIVHVEAGLRNYNKLVPEEINRVLTDRVSSLKIAPTQHAFANLKKEGLEEGTFVTGDIITDVIYEAIEKFRQPESRKYFYMTIHRPFNTTCSSRMKKLLGEVNKLPYPVDFAVHPRTSKFIDESGIDKAQYANVNFMSPVSFFHGLELINGAVGIITDSGGIQREAYIMKKPCVTILPKTPWEETLVGGWNRIVFDDLEELPEKMEESPDDGLYKTNYFGDGKVAARILDLLRNYQNNEKVSRD